MADSPEEKGKIDLDKILLPKKDAPSTDSAQRVNAGALLAQEQKAELPKPEPVAPPAAPEKKPAPVEETVVKPLQTFQGDIEKVVQQQNISSVSIAAAEAQRRASQSLEQTAAPKFTLERLRTFGAWTGGAALLLAAVMLIASLFTAPRSVTNPTAPESPYIAVDQTAVVALPESRLTTEALMREAKSLRDTFGISLGLVARIMVGVSSSTAETRELTTEEFLTIFTPRIPDVLLRTLEPRFLLGIHSYDGNQPFLILKTDSYESAFSGLLAWEGTMRNDLLPLFDRTPPIRTAPSATSTTTVPVFLQTEFVDRIVDNHDARVVQNEHKDILLLWTFLDRRTILITTNDATVREVTRRLKDAPIISVP